jgi:hypothetical protein
MAITAQQAHEMPLGELKRAAGLGPVPPLPEKSQEEQNVDKAFSEFQTRYPAFKKNPHNTATLFLHLDQWPPSVETFRQAHALATYEKRYNDEQAQTVKPEEAYSVDMQTLHEAAFGGPERDPAQSMDIAELKKAAGLA